MNPMSHLARTNRRHDFGDYTAMKDSQGITGFTKKHEKGHSIPQAAIANILHIASFHRGMPEHHAIYIQKVRKLRKHGTWHI